MKQEYNIILLSLEELFIIQVETWCVNKKTTDKPSVDLTYQTHIRYAQDVTRLYSCDSNDLRSCDSGRAMSKNFSEDGRGDLRVIFYAECSSTILYHTSC